MVTRSLVDVVYVPPQKPAGAWAAAGALTTSATQQRSSTARMTREYPFPMRGAIAAGHPLTADAGARVLEAGGNAVDAAVAAALLSWVAESPLTGPGAGGFMLVHRARDRSTRVFDFFVAVPGLGLATRELAEMDRVDVDFSGGSTQIFHIGAASCAIPGAAVGLETAHRAFGRLPWRDLFQPAIELARNGVEINKGQAYLHAILDLILRHTSESRAVYERNGCFTKRDLEEYRVIRRRPIDVEFCGDEFLSNPPPSAGGILIAYGLPLLEELGVGEPGRAEAIDALARVMREQAQARVGRGGLARALEQRAAVVARGTTHISVVDGRGNAVALTASTGAGSGVIVPGTGIHINNMIGEFDLPKSPRPGSRLSSMMSPSVVLHERRPRLVVGSAGSLRLRGAVMQIVVNVIGHGLPVEDAIERPRVHLEGDDLHCEGGHEPSELDRLEAMGWNVMRWRRRNLFFGGAAAVTLEDGKLAAAGDPRRGGAGVGVEW